MTGPGSAPPVASPAAQVETAITGILRWATRSDVRRATIERAGTNLPPTGAWLLARIVAAESPRVGDLAAWLDVDKSTITPQVQRLEREGYVSRAPDADDRRAVRVVATPAGHEVLRRLHAARSELLEELLADWPDGDQRELARLMTRLADRVAPPVTAD